MSIWTGAFWKDASERAIKTAAQTALGSVVVANVSLWDIDWTAGLGITATATVASLLTSIASAGLGSAGTASAIPTGRHRKVE